MYSHIHTTIGPYWRKLLWQTKINYLRSFWENLNYMFNLKILSNYYTFIKFYIYFKNVIYFMLNSYFFIFNQTVCKLYDFSSKTFLQLDNYCQISTTLFRRTIMKSTFCGVRVNRKLLVWTQFFGVNSLKKRNSQKFLLFQHWVLHFICTHSKQQVVFDVIANW